MKLLTLLLLTNNLSLIRGQQLFYKHPLKRQLGKGGGTAASGGGGSGSGGDGTVAGSNFNDKSNSDKAGTAAVAGGAALNTMIVGYDPQKEEEERKRAEEEAKKKAEEEAKHKEEEDGEKNKKYQEYVKIPRPPKASTQKVGYDNPCKLDCPDLSCQCKDGFQCAQPIL